MSWLHDHCGSLLDTNEIAACEKKYSSLWEIREAAPTVLMYAVVLIGGIWLLRLIYRRRHEIEDGFVSAAAGVIKGKRKVSAHFSSLRARIAEKADEPTNT